VATAAGELDGAGCTCRRGRSEGDGAEGDAATGDTAAGEPAGSEDGTGETVAEDKRKDEGAAGPRRPNPAAEERIVETAGDARG
jgi:hypothetical protein